MNYFIITEPPEALSIELNDEYVKGLSSTINCTSTMNPNTTKVFLIKKILNSQYVIPTNDGTIFVEPADEDGCNPNVRIVFQAANLDWTDIDSLACMVEDKNYSKNFTSKFKHTRIINPF